MLPPEKPNIVQAWLELIGTPERAARLLEQPWSCCPSAALFDALESSRIYANPRYRPALDAWDTGRVVRRDILVWAEYVRSGKYKNAEGRPGPYYFIQYITVPRADPTSLELVHPSA